MTTPRAVHSTFSIERVYPYSPAKVFAAWSSKAAKEMWFSGPPTWQCIQRDFDFRIGGQELLHGRFADGPETVFKSHYFDIVANERIVYAYDMLVNNERISVSLASITFSAQDSGTRMVLTEQGFHFDGEKGAAGREHGTLVLIDRLSESLKHSR